MATIHTWINFNGNAEEAFTFYKSVLGGDFEKVLRFKDGMGTGGHISEHEAEKIMYIALRVGENVLIGNDVPESMGRTNERENRSKIALRAESLEEAERLFKGLSVGGEIEMPLGTSPWGSLFAMFRDTYGIEWTIDFQ